jgi:hypothetical protein
VGEITLTLIDAYGGTASQTFQVTITPKPPSSFDLILSPGVNFIHLPLKATELRPVSRLSDLFDLLGGAANVHWLITTQPSALNQPSRFWTFLGDDASPANRELRPGMGVIVSMKRPVTLTLSGEPVGGELYLYPGINLIGLPYERMSVQRLSELIQRNGFRGNVTLVALYTNGGFRALTPEQILANPAADFELSTGQALAVVARTAAIARIE